MTKKSIRLIAMLLVSILTVTEGGAQNPLDAALGFNIFAEQNITTSGGDIEGGIAMGNNFGISTGWSQMTCQNAGAGNWYGTVGSTNYGLVVHGLVNWLGGGFNVNANGNNNWLKIANLNGGSINQNGQNINMQLNGVQLNVNSTNQTTGQVLGTTSINFASAFSTLRNTSNSFSNCSNTITPNYDIGNPNPKITLSTANNGKNIWNITGSQLTSWQSITFNNQPNSSQALIINVDATGTINLSNFPNMAGIGRTEGRYIIWNFYNATTINLSGGGMVEGSILAPNATINKTSSNNIEGQIICVNFTQTIGEVHVAAYNHNTSTCAISCSNVTSAGTIGTNQSTCASSYNPPLISETAAPAGGSGTLEYQWQISTNNNTWTDISAATAQTYDPPSSITVTTYYRRGVRRSGCTTYIYTNTVTMTIGVGLSANAGADKTQCYNSLFLLSANTLGSGESGIWTVVNGTALIDNPSSTTTSVSVAAGQNATLRWTVSKSGCTSVSDDVVLTNTTNCSTTCPANALNFNGDLESEGTATNFNLTFQGTPARLIDGSNRPTGWVDLYGSTPTNTTTFQGAFYLKKTGAAGNPHSGTHAVFMKGNGFCLGALGTSGNFSCGRTYRFSVWVAAYTNGATQAVAPFMIEYASSGGSSHNASVELIAPASTSWNSLNWQRYEFDITIPTGNTADTWGQFYFTTLDDNTGIVVDDVCITALNTGSYADAGVDQGTCNNVFTMSANTPASGYTGTWSVVSGSATIASPNSPTSSVTITSGNAATLRWTVSNGTGCTGFDEVVIGYQTVANITVNNTTICSGNSATLTATGCTGNLLWSTGATTNSITVNPTATTNYSVTCTPSGSTNLLLNPNFEATFDLENWSGWGYAAITTTPSEIQNGAKAAKIPAGDGGGGLGQNVAASPGQYYTLSIWGRVSDPAIGGGVTLEFLNASWAPIGSVYIPFTSNTYTQYTVSATAPIGTTQVQVGFWFNQGATGFVDNCSLVRTYNNCAKTATGTVTVNPTASISTQPTGFTECLGGTQSLSVTALNTSTYQWQSSPNNSTWTNVSGATSATYTPPSVSASTTYYRVVANSASCGSVNSTSATVIVVADPSVSISGGGVTICSGSSTTLTANVLNGTGTTTYQWQSSTDNNTFSNISGATNSTYTTTSLTTTTYYKVIINQTGNGCGSATSTSATVTVTNCQGSVGNYVWTDISGDGLNNEPTNAGLNGVTVQLYNSANTLIATTVTANDGTGNPGYYNFVIATSGDYYVKFPLTFGSKIISPFQTTTAGVDNNTDANPSTGNSPIFTINIMGSGVAKDNPTIDAAYKCNLTASATSSNIINCSNSTATLTATPSNGMTYAWNNGVTTPTQIVSSGGTYTVTVTDVANGCVTSANVTVTVTPMATVGNYIWTDTNGNGLNDEATTAGINGITVQLWNSSTNTLIATTTSASNGGNPGYYQFCVTSSGSYYIKFPTVNGIGRGLTTQTTTAATDNNSDANVTTGQSPIFNLDVNGTGTAKNNMTIDAAYKAPCPTGNCVNMTITKTN